MKVLDAALRYAGMGLSIIPLRPQDKKPFVKWQSHQKEKASPEQIRAWWRTWSDAMIGIVTGMVSGLLVIDCDTAEAYEWLQEYLPDTLETPIVETPRGGRHVYFAYDECGLTIGEDVHPDIKGVDFRGQGGYVVVPPSVNGTGKAYAWVDEVSLDNVRPAPAPPSLIEYLKSFSIYKGGQGGGPQETTETTSDHKNEELFVEGRRDSDIFHVLNCAVKGGLTRDYALQTGFALARNCTPPFSEAEIPAKIESALKRAARREGSIAADVRGWVETTDGHFETTTCHRELQLTTKERMKAANMELLRLCEGPNAVLERYGSKRGVYRRIEHDLDIMDLTKASTAEFPLVLPLGVHELAKIYPSNIVLVGGQKSAGKTAYMLNTVLLNRDRFTKDEILYLNSEMGEEEARMRCEKFPGMTVERWSNIFTLGSGPSNQWDVIKPGRKLVLIDFLEPPSEKLFLIKEQLNSIHQKLIQTRAVALVAVQIHPDKEYVLGKGFAREKPRLIVHLTYDHEKRLHTIKIDEAKAWRKQNPRGMNRQYKLVDAHKLVPEKEGWHV